MPLNRRIAEDATLEGVMQIKGWMDEFMAQWNEPLVKLERAKQVDQAVIAWEMMPDEMRSELQEQAPAQYAAAEKMYRKLKKGQNNGQNSIVNPVGSNANSYAPNGAGRSK